MSKSITQDMAYRQSLMKYAEKYGVSRASRKYNKSRSYIYFWKARWDGTVESLACQSRRPHSHPNQHTETELKLIRDMRRRNPNLGMVELWHRLRLRGYTRRPESLFRVMRKLGLFPAASKKKVYKTSVYKGYKRDKIEMRGDRAEISDFPLYLNTVAGGLDCRDQTIGGFSFVVKIYAVPVVEIIG